MPVVEVSLFSSIYEKGIFSVEKLEGRAERKRGIALRFFVGFRRLLGVFFPTDRLLRGKQKRGDEKRKDEKFQVRGEKTREK